MADSQLTFALRETPTRTPASHCKRGHLFTVETTGFIRAGIRFCKICDKARKRDWLKKKNTKEPPVEVVCPKCGKTRMVVWTTARRLKKTPRWCFSCCRKDVRGRMAFTPGQCVECGCEFTRRSGASLRCDDCAKLKPLIPKECPVCGSEFYGYKNKTACSQSCKRRLRINESYFGGRMFEAEGWKDKKCIICGRHRSRKFHIHHVFGHPDHSRLVVMCPSCHDIVSKVACRKTLNVDQIAKVFWFALAQKLGTNPDSQISELLASKVHAAGDEQPHVSIVITEQTALS